MEKREIHGLDLVLARVYFLVVSVLKYRLEQKKWLIDAGLDVSIEPGRLFEREFRRISIRPVGWPERDYIFLRATETQGMGWHIVDVLLCLPDLGVDQQYLYQAFHIMPRFGCEWRLTDFSGEKVFTAEDFPALPSTK